MKTIGEDDRWYLAQFRPNAHAVAERNLIRQGFLTFLPMQEITYRKNSHFLTKQTPLYPGYLFVAFSMAKGGWRAIDSTHGVSRLVRFGETPTPVPEELVDGLIERFSKNDRVIARNRFHPGDKVAVTKGPLAEFAATVEYIEPERRVWVLLDFMGRATRAAFNPAALRNAYGS